MAGIAAARRWVALVVLGLGASLLAIVGPTAGPASAEGEVTVTWPSVTAFNPDLADFVVQISDEGPGTLRFKVAGVITPAASNGSTVVTMPDRDGPATVQLERCTTGCVQIESKVIAIYRRLIDGRPAAGLLGPELPPVIMDVFEPVAPHDVDWELRTSDGADASVLASGSGPVAPRLGQYYNGLTGYPIEIPDGLVHGERYYYVAAGTAQTEAFGELTGQVNQWFTWDERVEARVKMSRTTVYPNADDRRLSRVRFLVDAQTSEREATRLVVRNAVGETIFDRPLPYTWSVVDQSGLQLPGGIYDLTVIVRDEIGNTRDYPFRLAVSDETPSVQHWAKTVRPHDVMVDTWVGRCSTLRAPALGGRRGSIGLYSGTKCRRADQLPVVAVQELMLPESLTGRYENLRVTVTGGKARGERDAYLVMYYWNFSEKKWRSRVVFSGKNGDHRGPTTDSPQMLFRDDDGRTWVAWWIGLTDGSRYDVQRFTVEVDYIGLS